MCRLARLPAGWCMHAYTRAVSSSTKVFMGTLQAFHPRHPQLRCSWRIAQGWEEELRDPSGVWVAGQVGAGGCEPVGKELWIVWSRLRLEVHVEKTCLASIACPQSCQQRTLALPH